MLKELLTPRFVRDDGSRCYNWGEWTPRFDGPRLSIENLGNYDGCLTLIIGLIFCTFYIHLNVKHNWDMWENAIGFYFSDDALVLEWPWGGRHKQGRRLFLHYPWFLDFQQRWEVVEDGRMENGNWKRDAWNWVLVPRCIGHGMIATKHVYDFEYTLKSGEVQKRKATVYVDRMEWRRRWMPWTSLFNLIKDNINISFDGEVGEQTGSWKGGVMGCSYELLPGEAPKDCLARMAKDCV